MLAMEDTRIASTAKRVESLTKRQVSVSMSVLCVRMSACILAACVCLFPSVSTSPFRLSIFAFHLCAHTQSKDASARLSYSGIEFTQYYFATLVLCRHFVSPAPGHSQPQTSHPPLPSPPPASFSLTCICMWKFFAAALPSPSR